MHPIDLYCERAGPGLLAEPFNTVSNAAFFLAAWLLWRKTSASRVPAGLAVLIALIVAIGLGSTAFHLFATRETRSLDLLPILAFELFFLWYYARRAVRLTPGVAAVLVVVLLALSLYAERHAQPLNGSLLYVPALGALIAMAAHQWSTRPEGRDLAAACALLLLSLAFRTLDQAACPWLPVGTHFLWHLLNAAVLYLCVRSVARLSIWRDPM